MEYMELLKNIGTCIFAVVFWVMCYKLEKAVSSLKD